MRRLSAASFLLAAYTLLGVTLLWSNGTFHPIALALDLAGFVMACIGVWQARLHHEANPPVRMAAVCLAVLLVLQVNLTPGMYLESRLYDSFFWVPALLFAAAVFLAYCFARIRHSIVRTVVFCILLVWGLGLTVTMPFASPQPVIDVFVMLQTSASALLSGHNPYLTAIPDVYAGANGAPLPGLVYPPASLWIIAPFFGVFQDVRFAMIAGVMVALAAVWRLSGMRFAMDGHDDDDHAAWSELLVLLLLWHPRGFFVIEQSWIDPLILGLLGLSLWFRLENKPGVSAGVYGLMLSLKQYLVFLLPLFFVLERRPKQWLQLGLIGFLTLVPFLLISPTALWSNGIVYQLADHFRPYALTVPSLFWFWYGWEPGRWWSLAVGVVACALSIGLTRRMKQPVGFLLAAAFTQWAIFLFGSQGFANYYWLVCGLLIFALASMHGKTAHHAA